MAIEYVIDLVNEDQTDTFIKAWNEAHAEQFGPVRKKWNDHDFGPYPSVVMSGKRYYDNLEKYENFEDLVTELADQLGLEY